MRLQDLVQNIPAQVLKINGVINYETHFVDYVAKKGQPDWAAFRSSVWGNPLALGLEWQWEHHHGSSWEPSRCVGSSERKDLGTLRVRASRASSSEGKY